MRLAQLSSTALAVIAATLGTVLIVPGTTDAADVKVFPGSACQPSANATEAHAPTYSTLNGVFAMEAPSGTSGLGGSTITCPITRDNQANTTGFKLSVWVDDFWDAGSGAEIDQIICSASIVRVDTAPSPDVYGRVDFETRSTSVGATGVKKLDWGTSLATGAVDGSYSLDCFVPTYSTLINYRTDEP